MAILVKMEEEMEVGVETVNVMEELVVRVVVEEMTVKAIDEVIVMALVVEVKKLKWKWKR